MSAVRMWVQLDLRRRWRSLTVLALLVALASGTIMATLAGARRGASAIERLSERTLPATVVALPNTPGFDWDTIRALPEVEVLTTFLVGSTFAVDGVPGENLGFALGDDAAMRTIEKPVLVEGRAFDPARPDEVVVSRNFAEKRHLGVGDTVTIRLPTPQEAMEMALSDTPGALHGPAVKARIVGVVISPWFTDAQAAPTGSLQVSPGLTARYPDNLLGPKNPENPLFQNALIRLKGGEAAIPAFTESLKQATKRSDIDIWNRPQQLAEVQRHITFITQCLLAFAVAVFAAALFLIGQAIARFTAGSVAETQTLRAIGMTPRQAVITATVGPVLFAVLGVVLGAGAAIAASPLFPFGAMPRGLEPKLGVDADWLVLGTVAVVVVVLVLLAAAVSSALIASSAGAPPAGRRSLVASAVQRAGLGVPVLVGTRFALEPGRGRTSVPVRPALIGAVIGVLGVVSAFTFAHGVADAGRSPERFGQTFQLGAFLGINDQTFAPQDKVYAAALATKDVAGVNDTRTAIATGANEVTTSLWEFDGGPKPIPIVMLAGRLPRGADEVVLGPTSLSDLNTAVGKTVQLTGSTGVARTLTVTGSGFLPIGPHNNYPDGGWISSSGFDSLFDGFKYRIELVSVRPGADVTAAGTALNAAVAKAVPDLGPEAFTPPDSPAELAQIREVQVLPIALGLFLVVLALGAVGHAISTAVRRRSVDIAVLRALGLTRRQSRWVVVTQASVLAVFGLVFGVPLGLALGRNVWRVVADTTPLQYVPPLALWVLLLVGPLALLTANLLGAWPGHRAARLRVAHVLRTE